MRRKYPENHQNSAETFVEASKFPQKLFKYASKFAQKNRKGIKSYPKSIQKDINIYPENIYVIIKSLYEIIESIKTCL